MSITTAWRSCLILSLLVCAKPEGAAAQSSAPFMEVGRQVAPPRGYITFCLREPDECPVVRGARLNLSEAQLESNYWKLLFDAVEPAALPVEGSTPWGSRIPYPDAGTDRAAPTSSEGAVVELTPHLWKQLNKINRRTNQRIHSASDRSLYGQNDFWAIPLKQGGQRGDCEDYALEKRRALRVAGLTDQELSLALVKTAYGQDHAVLVVRTSSGDMVLDSLSPWVRRWNETGYQWLSRQSPSDPSVWVMGPPL